MRSQPSNNQSQLTELLLSRNFSEGTFKSEPEAFFADDERTVALVRNTGTRKGRVMDTYVIHVFRVRDGKLFEVTTFASEPKRNEEFWS